MKKVDHEKYAHPNEKVDHEKNVEGEVKLLRGVLCPGCARLHTKAE